MVKSYQNKTKTLQLIFSKLNKLAKKSKEVYLWDKPSETVEKTVRSVLKKLFSGEKVVFEFERNFVTLVELKDEMIVFTNRRYESSGIYDEVDIYSFV